MPESGQACAEMTYRFDGTELEVPEDTLALFWAGMRRRCATRPHRTRSSSGRGPILGTGR